MKLKRRNKMIAELNMTSLTDVVFILLIFILVTHSINPKPILKVLLPKGALDEVVKQTVVLRVSADLEYSIDKKIIPFERLPDEMAAVLELQPGATVSIHGDKSVNYEKVMEMVYMVNILKGKPVLALEPVKK
jgi:biopolymer transport protein ExbD